MGRRLLLAVCLALVVVSCSDDSPAPLSTASSTSTSSTTTSTTTTEVPAALLSVPAPPASTLDGVLALTHPVVIGHAGGDRAWPHSTMYGFTEAARAGTHVLEMDVQLTGDGVLVVQHDDTVDRTTEATGRVRDFTYDQLQALDNGYWWSGEWGNHDLPDDAYVYRGIRTGEVEPPPGYGPDDFRVETFRSVAEAFPDHVLDIEIKVPGADPGEGEFDFAIDGARVLAEEIEQLGRTDSVVVVSFDDDVTVAFREFAPGVTTSPGETAIFSWLVGSADLHPNDRILQLPPEHDGIDVLGIEGLFPKADEEGLAIWVFPNDADTQENPDFYVELIERGVDGVLVGRPDQAMERFRADGILPEDQG